MQKSVVTVRAVLLGLVLIPINSYWIVQMESVHYAAHSTNYSLFFNTVCNLLVLTAANVPLRKISPTLAFSQTELLTIYIMLNLSAALVGSGMMQLLPPAMAAPFGLATPENEWKQLFGQYIPTWLAITDQRTLDAYITGVKTESSLYVARHLEAWLGAVLIWSGFISVLMFVLICVNVIIRRQWTDREKLTYPITQLPFEMASPTGGLFRNKLFLIGFASVGAVNVINGLHSFFPALLNLRVKPYDLAPFFTAEPWSALGYTPFTFRPFLAGLIFLIPLDMSFSCWFFFFSGRRS